MDTPPDGSNKSEAQTTNKLLTKISDQNYYMVLFLAILVMCESCGGRTHQILQELREANTTLHSIDNRLAESQGSAKGSKE